MDVIEATAMLHNIGIRWGDTMAREVYPLAPPGMPPALHDVIVVDEAPRDRATRLQQGNQVREGLLRRSLLIPASPQELRHLRERN